MERTSKKLKFTPSLVAKILTGEKTSTWRMFDEKDLSQGDHLELLDVKTGNKFANAEIVSVVEKSLKELEKEDFTGHEMYESKDVMLERYKKYYGEKVTFDTSIKLIRFRLIGVISK